MDVYKSKIQSDGSLNKLKLIIVVRGYLHNNEIIGDNWGPTASMSTLKYFLEDSDNHKEIVYQLDFIKSFIQAIFRHRVFVSLDSRYG